MHWMRFRHAAALGLAVLVTSLPAAADIIKPPPKSMADAELIKIALAAAPAGIAKHATVVTMETGGTMRTLRAGTNGFTCMPGNLAFPGPDAMCVDRAALAWMHAYMDRKSPPSRVGLAYMLAGGTDPSNIDPFSDEPPRDGKWIRTGPHLMILGADKAFYEQYPKGNDPDTSMPYVMWAGTPYEHLMVPVL